MKKVIIGLCILCMVGMVGWRVTKNMRQQSAAEELLLRSSDAKKYTDNITILGDEWLGYMIFRSRTFQDYLAEADIGVTFQIEHDFEARFQALKNAEADLVLATADSYLVNGQSSNYPGVICAIIDESFGGDALIAGPGINSLDDLNTKNIKGAYVGHSPSEFLLKSQVAHFQLHELAPQLPSFRADTAEEAYNQLKQGKADFAVLWEPFASRALQNIPDTTRLIDTSKAQDLIIDVAIASRQIAADNPKLLQKVLFAYYRALHDLQSDADRLLSQATIDSGEQQEVAKQMLSGIRFVNYEDNKTQWLDTAGSFRIERALSSISTILREVGDLKTAPTNLASLVHSKSLLQIESNLKKLPQAQSTASSSLGHYFRPLSADDWSNLQNQATGTLMNRPISFSAGSSEIDEETKTKLLEASKKLLHYPYHRLIVEAHVSPGGGAEVETELSQNRAQIIKEFLLANTDLTPERVYAKGVGAQYSPPKKAEESSRAWKRRCRRASILIAAE